jgi:single stranded DNA-binding protein
MGLNTISLDGRLVRDAEVRMAAGSGKPYTNIRIAFDRWNKQKRESEANFISVRVFKDLPLKKGQAIVVRGELEIREFDKEGTTVTWPQIVAHECFPINYVKVDRGGANSPWTPGVGQPQGNVDNVVNAFGGTVQPPASSPPPASSFEDDVPF